MAVSSGRAPIRFARRAMARSTSRSRDPTASSSGSLGFAGSTPLASHDIAGSQRRSCHVRDRERNSRERQAIARNRTAARRPVPVRVLRGPRARGEERRHWSHALRQARDRVSARPRWVVVSRLRSLSPGTWMRAGEVRDASGRVRLRNAPNARLRQRWGGRFAHACHWLARSSARRHRRSRPIERAAR